MSGRHRMKRGAVKFGHDPRFLWRPVDNTAFAKLLRVIARRRNGKPDLRAAVSGATRSYRLPIAGGCLDEGRAPEMESVL